MRFAVSVCACVRAHARTLCAQVGRRDSSIEWMRAQHLHTEFPELVDEGTDHMEVIIIIIIIIIII